MPLMPCERLSQINSDAAGGGRPDARRGIRDDARQPRRLPARYCRSRHRRPRSSSGRRHRRKAPTTPASRSLIFSWISLSAGLAGAGFGAVLLIADDDQIADDDRRAAEAVLAFERAEAAPPDFAAIVIEGQQQIFFRRGPSDVNVLRIDGGRAGGEAVLRVDMVERRGKRFLPDRWPSAAARGQDESACRFADRRTVRKILSPHNTGDECPTPGNSTFQL